MKECFKCGETKPLAAFYPHPRMADGHLNKCKECAKRDVRARYKVAREARSEYEKRRSREPTRKALVLAYQRLRRERYPEKDRARAAVSYAIRSGRLIEKPCEVCGTTRDVEAHHDDYSKPLDVRWLCFKHHREVAHGQHVTCHSF